MIAGEPSGDILGGRLMSALHHANGEEIEFAGVGGDMMQREGLKSLFPMMELSVMGVVEILPRLLHFFRRMRETANAIREFSPDVIVTIDAPAFCFGVLKRLRTRDCPRIHYVAPTVWAWRPWRVGKFARVFDHLMTLLPFEAPYFEKAGLRTSFVGHPVLESAHDADGERFRKSHGITDGGQILCVLPGSRLGEISRHLEPFGEAVALLQKRFPALRVVIPTLPVHLSTIGKGVADWPGAVLVINGEDEKYDAMAAADVALAASGTVALELALTRTPSVIAYRLNPLTYAIVVRMVKIRFVSLVNLLIDREAQPELIQNFCTGEKLAEAIGNLMVNSEIRDAQCQAAEKAIAMLSVEGTPPSQRAAEVVLNVVRENRRIENEC